MIPSLGGEPIFGICVTIRMIPNANANQVAEFFGVNGYQSLDGGTRGRIFEVQGILTGVTPGLIVAGSEAALMSFANGNVNTLVDTVGVSWSNVVFKGEYVPGDQFMFLPGLGVWGRPYRCVLRGLT